MVVQDFEDIREGQEIKIIYLPSDPKISYACNPQTDWQSEKTFLFVVPTIATTMIDALFFYDARKYHKKYFRERTPMKGNFT